MKNFFKNIQKNEWTKFIFAIVLLALVMIILHNCCDSETNLAMAIISGVAGGKHISAQPLTREITEIASPDLLVNEIDKRIVKIRPMATPIDQLSRWAGAKRSGSMIVDYYSVDTRPTTSVTTEGWEGCSDTTGGKNFQKASLKVENPDAFEPSETILVRGIKGYEPNGTTISVQDLVLYILSKNPTTNTLDVISVNGKTIGQFPQCIPSIPSGTTIVRMGRAASELDVQTSQFEALPVKSSNYCQIFKMQIEQSTLNKIASKEVSWSFSDQEEAAIYDMRLGMEKNFLFGVKNRLTDTNKHEDIFFTGGIWGQAGNEFHYKSNSLNQDSIINMMRKAFTGNAGNKRKVLIGGSGLIERLNKLESTKVIMSGDEKVKWGIDFSEIRSKFGKLYVLLSEVFDECGMENNGMIIDPEYLQKYSHIPFSTEQINLKSAGVRNTDAIVLTEASCMTLKYPKAHMRIIMD